LEKIRNIYKIYIVKDDFSIQIKKWFADAGDETLRLNYPELTRESVVFDLGGYLGDFAAEINVRYGCKIYIFEPHPYYYSECLKRFSSDKNITVLNYGLADSNGELFLSDHQDGSSFVNPNHIRENGIKCILRDFIDVIDELDVPKIDLMKINIEGGEFPLLEHIIAFGRQTLIEQYQIQFHNFVDNAIEKRSSIMSALSETHTQTWCYNFVWENWRKN
jgi:FkbM family methyltransferase